MHLTEAQKRAYVIADNRRALDAGWDEDLLAEELEALEDLDFNLELTGFDLDELGGLLDDETAEEVAAPEPPEEPVNWLPGLDTTRTPLTQLTEAQASRIQQLERLMA